jgi:hypothetical protein
MKSFYIIRERKKLAYIIMLHASSTNRPTVKSRGPTQSTEEHQKEPCKSVKENQADEDPAVSCRTNYHKHPHHQKNYIYTKDM